MSKTIQLLVLMALALWACVKEVQATQVLVVVESDLGSDAASYEVRVTDAREMATGYRDVVTTRPPFSFAVVPADKAPVSTNLIIVSALDESGNVIAVAKTLVTFRDRAAVQVTVRLTQACRGRICDAGFSCEPAAGECVELQATQGKEVTGPFKPGSEFTMEGATVGEDGGAGTGGAPGGDGTMSGSASGMAGGTQSMAGGAGGNPTGASPTGGSASAGGGAPAGGTNAGGTTTGGAAPGGATDGGSTPGGTTGGGSSPGGTTDAGTPAGGGAMMGGTLDAGVDAGPPPECDATRTCSSGYTCVSNKCVSRCSQTTCDPNATCSLNASGNPVCTCNTNYLTVTGAGGAVTCMRLQACTDLGCNPTSTTCEAPAGMQPRCACRPGYTGATCAPVSCGALTVVNGSVDTGTGTFGATATYNCTTGYTRTGGTTRRCEANGTWSGTAASCAPVSCGTLSVANGSVDTGTGTFGATATYNCNTGYNRTGGTTRRCEANGTWSGTAATCAIHNCGTPPAPARGNVVVSGGTSLGATVTYTCSSPFRVSPDNASRTCTASGWNGSTPSCIGCGDGVLQSGEQCDHATGDPWHCTTTCQSTNLYNSCMDDSDCGSGLTCYVGSCIVGCAAGGQCPQLSSRATSGTMSCLGSFGCFLSCTSRAQCAPGNICRGGTCQGCDPSVANECPSGQLCVGMSEQGLGTCR